MRGRGAGARWTGRRAGERRWAPAAPPVNAGTKSKWNERDSKETITNALRLIRSPIVAQFVVDMAAFSLNAQIEQTPVSRIGETGGVHFLELRSCPETFRQLFLPAKVQSQ